MLQERVRCLLVRSLQNEERRVQKGHRVVFVTAVVARLFHCSLSISLRGLNRRRIVAVVLVIAYTSVLSLIVALIYTA